MIVYKIDVLQELKDNGISSYKILKDNLLSQGTVTKLRNKDTDISVKSLNKICELLGYQPGNVLKYVPDEN